MISGKTQLLGIFGDPVSHSLSPKMQNAALTAAAIDAAYLPLHVTAERLELAVEAIRTFNFVGMNVTVPHKERIIPFLDEVDETATLIGAVNTVVNRQGYLVGFNTDASGFLASLQSDLLTEPQGQQVIIVGAGGASRAAVVALAGSGALKIVITNRSKEKAENLACEMQQHFPETEIVAYGLSEAELADSLSSADLLVNTTSVGLSGDTLPTFFVDKIAESACVYDMVYADSPTPLIRSARSRGLSCVDGRGMLVAQGEAAFFKWFGIAPETGVMRAQVFEK